jgi:hypothetical protein
MRISFPMRRWLQALAYAPDIMVGLPVQLGGTESSCNNFGAPVGSI